APPRSITIVNKWSGCGGATVERGCGGATVERGNGSRQGNLTKASASVADPAQRHRSNAQVGGDVMLRDTLHNVGIAHHQFLVALLRGVSEVSIELLLGLGQSAEQVFFELFF